MNEYEFTIRIRGIGHNSVEALADALDKLAIEPETVAIEDTKNVGFVEDAA